MSKTDSLIQKIRTSFGSIPFPSHCGLHAAIAMDDWISDEEILREITQRNDYIGEWWDVPEEHLAECMMALDYLDASAMNFYLPAYLTAILEHPTVFDKVGIRSSAWRVISTMTPSDESEPDLQAYFQERFSPIRDAKKCVCREFLEYVALSNVYNEHASELAKKALAHEFWSNAS